MQVSGVNLSVSNKRDVIFGRGVSKLEVLLIFFFFLTRSVTFLDVVMWVVVFTRGGGRCGQFSSAASSVLRV